MAALFVMGNYQQFLDSSLLILLRGISLLSLLCIASGVFYLASLLIWMVRRRHMMLLRAVYGVIAVAVGAVASAGTGLLQSLVLPS